MFSLAPTHLPDAESFALPALVPPSQPSVLRFGGGQVALAPPSPLFSLGSRFTIESWIYLEVPAPFGVIVGKRLDSDPFVAYALQFGESGRRVEFAQSTGQPGSYRAVTSSDLPLQTWTHVAAALDGSVMRLFVNGAEVATGESPGLPAPAETVPLSIGAAGSAGSTSGVYAPLSTFAVLREVRVWSRALTSGELLENVRRLTGNESGLLADWPLEEGVGQTAGDISANRLNLRIGLEAGLDPADPQWVRTTLLDSGPYLSIAAQRSSGKPDDGRMLHLGADGRLDLVATQFVFPPAPASVLGFRNDGRGGFTDASSEIFSGQEVQTVHPRHYAVGDFNGDGRSDLFIADHGPDLPPYPGGQSRILVQGAAGTLSDETVTRIPTRLAFTHHVAAADIDGDGDIDLYLCNIGSQDHVGPHFLINDGTGHFQEDTTRLPGDLAGLGAGRVYESAILIDVNGDGHPDLVLGALENQGVPRDALLLNDGTAHFQFAPGISMPERYGGPNWGTVNIASADFDGDGWPDLLLSVQDDYRQPGLQLLLNDRHGAFRDATSRIPQTWPRSVGAGQIWIKWVMPFDLNGDDRMDFVTTGSNLSAHLYLNLGNAAFVDASEVLPVSANLTSVIPGDVDDDGRPDLVLLTKGTDYFVAHNVKGLDPRLLLEPCASGPTTLCLNGGRFKVTTQWTTNGGQTGSGQAVALTGDTGYFTFFGPANVEMLVKVLNGCGFNGRFWTFAGGLTDVHVVMAVTDTLTGAVKSYANPQGTAFQPIQDTDAFATCASSTGAGVRPAVVPAAPRSYRATVSGPSEVSEVCVSDSTTLCLNNSRYKVQTRWFTRDGASGSGQVIPLTGDTGAFWFFSPENVEMVIKVLNGCGFNSRYWAFAAGLTDVNVILTVTDTQTGAVETYANPQGTPFQPIQDTTAFETCP